MPVDVARHAYFSTCKYIADQLMSLATSLELKSVTVIGMRNLALDTEACIEYAENSVTLINDSADLCTSAFTPLRQLCALFVEWGWERFLRNEDRIYAFGGVKPRVALFL